MWESFQSDLKSHSALETSYWRRWHGRALRLRVLIIDSPSGSDDKQSA